MFCFDCCVLLFTLLHLIRWFVVVLTLSGWLLFVSWGFDCFTVWFDLFGVNVSCLLLAWLLLLCWIGFIW